MFSRPKHGWIQVSYSISVWNFFRLITDEVVTTHGPIEPDKENVRQEPYSLPQGFMWDTLDLSNAEVVSVCKTNSYVLFWSAYLLLVICILFFISF